MPCGPGESAEPSRIKYYIEGRVMPSVPATEFNRNPSQIKRLAAREPVIITERDRPTLVVLSYSDYERLLGTPRDLAEWLEMDDDIDFEIDPVGLRLTPVTDP